MLDRRFTLVCFAVTLVAIGMAFLVTRTEEPTLWVELACAHCGPLAR